MSELNQTIDQAVKAMGDREGKYLTFSLANEEYGIGISKKSTTLMVIKLETA
jgi:purine-binding chemotaxis protein CheW